MAAALKKCEKGEEATQKLVARFTGGGLRAALLRNALKAATKYEVRARRRHRQRTRSSIAWTRSKMELVKDENQLCYLKEQADKAAGHYVTEQTWKDAAESWVAVLSLRSQIQVERGQAVLECMCADEKVLKAIGAAVQMSETVGEVPNDIVTLLSKGPGAHIRNEAYKYHKKIDAELARVRRIREIQVGVVAFIGTATRRRAARGRQRHRPRVQPADDRGWPAGGDRGGGGRRRPVALLPPCGQRVLHLPAEGWALTGDPIRSVRAAFVFCCVNSERVRAVFASGGLQCADSECGQWLRVDWRARRRGEKKRKLYIANDSTLFSYHFLLQNAS